MGYNFVTDVTSLVVKKPNEDKNVSSSDIGSNSENMQDVSSSRPGSPQSPKIKGGWSASYVNQKQVNNAYSQKVYIPKGGNNYGAYPLQHQSAPSLLGGGAYGPLSLNRIVGGAPRPNTSSSNKRLRTRLRPTSSSANFATTTATYITTTTTGGAFYDYDNDDYDADGIPDYDADGIPDHPNNIDTDGDGVSDDIDLIDDNDGILDSSDPDITTEQIKKEKNPDFQDC